MPIIYADKDKNAAEGTPERTWRDVDANEVKTVVNANETATAAAQAAADAAQADATQALSDAAAAQTDADTANAALATKADLVAGKVPASQLPAYVDDVLEFANLAAFPVTGEADKIYIAMDTNLTYRWSGSAYVNLDTSLALGETSATAYRGDRGKIAYDHSQIVSGNPHGVTAAQVGLGNVDNTNDAGKPVSTAQQAALNLKMNSLVSIKAKTASYTLGTDGTDLTDLTAGKYVMFTMDVVSSNVFTIPENATFAAPIGSQFGIRRIGAGVTTIAVSGAASVIATATALSDPGQYVIMWVEKTGTNTWLVQNGGNGTWVAYTPTFTGFSVQPTSVDASAVQLSSKTGIVGWDMVGGTSNATTFTMTMPFIARSQRRYSLLVQNAGTFGQGEAYTAAGSNIISFFRGASVWTASGVKAAWAGNLTIEIQ